MDTGVLLGPSSALYNDQLIPIINMSTFMPPPSPIPIWQSGGAAASTLPFANNAGAATNAGPMADFTNAAPDPSQQGGTMGIGKGPLGIPMFVWIVFAVFAIAFVALDVLHFR